MIVLWWLLRMRAVALIDCPSHSEAIAVTRLGKGSRFMGSNIAPFHPYGNEPDYPSFTEQSDRKGQISPVPDFLGLLGGAWVGHCRYYYSQRFFEMLAHECGYEILRTDILNDLRAVALRKREDGPFLISQEALCDEVVVA